MTSTAREEAETMTGDFTGSKTKKPRTKPKCPYKRQSQRSAANNRERNRMRTINGAFLELRERLPIACRERKVSKVDTLRLAINYIQHLRSTLQHVERAPATQNTCNYVTQQCQYFTNSDVTISSCRYATTTSGNMPFITTPMTSAMTTGDEYGTIGLKNQPLPFVQG